MFYKYNCLECPNGYKEGPSCVCNSGWIGANCQTCETPNACGLKYTCDTSPAIQQNEKFVTCEVQEEFEALLGREMNIQCSIPKISVFGNCTIQTFLPIIGSPQLFFCNMHQCAQETSKLTEQEGIISIDGEQTVWKCTHSECHCTGLVACPSVLRSFLEKMSGSSDFLCKRGEDCELFCK